MAIDEHARHHLHEMARSTWDDEAADGLMELLPPVGWADVATKRDLEQLEHRLEARIDARLSAFESRLGAFDGRFSALEARLLRWMIPTLLTGMVLAAGISRI